MPGPKAKVGRYQILGELGRGSMGIVYRAFDPVIGRPVAIKTLLTRGLSASEFQEYKARFQREAQAAGVLSHPNIVTVYDFGEENGVLYLAMECLEGESLDKVAEGKNILPIETVISIYEQVSSALDHAHAHNIVHRDIKPANIMILSSGLVKVTDFGIAKVMSAGMTQAGQILGTPNYMAPEQVKGRTVDGRSDIFSLGVILYELVTGEKPFGGQNITTVIYKIINENPVPPRELDAAIHPGLSYITSKALAKNPEDRYQSCRQMAEDLKNYKNLGVSPATGATVLRSPQVPSPPPDRVSEKTPSRPSPAQAAESEPPRQLNVQVIAPASREGGSGSRATWIFVTVLVMGVLGAGYYYRFGNPLKGWSGVLRETHLPRDRAPQSALAALPPAPGLGAITVSANVAGGRITIDGRSDPQWITPYTFSALSTGPHFITVSRDGYIDTQQTVVVEDGRTTVMSAELAAKLQPEPSRVASQPPLRPIADPPKTGQLVITANVDGARISVDGRSDPEWITPHTFTDVPGGTHTLSLSKEGFNPENRSVVVTGGHTTAINAELTVPGAVVNIVTIPPGAEVTVDGRPIGASPVRVSLRSGPHTYSAKLLGMPRYDGVFTLRDGVPLTRTVDWGGGSVSPSGIVEVRTIPPGATITADGAAIAHKTPANFRLLVGRHMLTLSLPGFTVAEREIEVPAGDSTPVKVYVTLSHQ